jgi:beta-glucanase (GH16 family)
MCPEVNPEILCHQMDVEIPDYSEDFLTYGMEWTPSKIIWYVNGKMVRNEANPGIHDPVRIIFNLAITPWQLPDETTPFPAEMEIDYLRIYGLDQDHQIPDSFRNHLNVLEGTAKDTLILGGEAGFNAVPRNENVTIRATKSIEIRGDFSVPLGAQLYLDVNDIE